MGSSMPFFVSAISVGSGETARMRIPCVLKFSDCFKNFAKDFIKLLRCDCDLYLPFLGKTQILFKFKNRYGIICLHQIILLS